MPPCDRIDNMQASDGVPPAQTQADNAASEDASGPTALQESDFLYNSAGLLVGPARQCHTAKGKPKQTFPSEDECRRWIAEHGNGKGIPYRCSFGHVHITNKSWTRPIIQKAPRET